MRISKFRSAAKDTNLKANHNLKQDAPGSYVAAKDTNLKANHNIKLEIPLENLAAKDTNLKANHNCFFYKSIFIALLKILI